MTILQWVPASSKKEIERPANDSGISYVIKGPVIYFIHPHYNHMLTCIFMGIFLYNVLALPSSFVFRYLSLINNQLVERLLQKRFLMPFFGFLIFLSICVFITMFLGDMPKEGAAAQVDIVPSFSAYYHYIGDNNQTRIGNLIHLNFMVYYSLLIVGVSICIGYIILIFSGVQIFR
uniref:Uncharacterized protein n=1 Tax=Acrobeloides nanus TaxID=290746 RepID=A0A914DGQ7_9BILA